MAKKQRVHKFVVRVTFSRALTKREALEAARNFGHMGPGSDDYFDIIRDEDLLGGKMRVTAMRLHRTEGRT